MNDIKYKDVLVASIGNIYNMQEEKVFSANPSDPLQYGVFKLPKGEILQRHIHKTRRRLTPHKTLEYLYIVSGALEVTFYTLDKEVLCSRVLTTGDFVMLYDGGHGFKSLLDGTRFIEIKNGPYIGVEYDKEKF